MKLIRIFPVLALLSIVWACGSSEEEPTPKSDGFFKFKVDGVQMELPVNDHLPMGFNYDPGGPVYGAVFQAFGEGSTGTSDFVNVGLMSENKFATGIDYELQDAVPYKGVGLARITFTYADKAGQIFNATLLQGLFPGLTVNDAATIRFTRITATEVEGTFSARVIGPVSPTTGRGTVEKVISDGQFKMKLLDNTN